VEAVRKKQWKIFAISWEGRIGKRMSCIERIKIVGTIAPELMPKFRKILLTKTAKSGFMHGSGCIRGGPLIRWIRFLKFRRFCTRVIQMLVKIAASDCRL
jgi:hypothetical protein